MGTQEAADLSRCRGIGKQDTIHRAVATQHIALDDPGEDKHQGEAIRALRCMPTKRVTFGHAVCFLDPD
jgi:hypothetical protein